MATTYATKAELKKRVAIETANTDSDDLLQQLLDDAAWMVDQLTRGAIEGKEAFSASAGDVRYFDDDGLGVVHIDDLLAVTSITVGGTTITSTYYKLYPYQPGNGPWTKILLRGDAPGATNTDWYDSPYEGIGLGQVVVTGTWGYCTQANRPAVVKEATLQIAALMYKQNSLSMTDVLGMLQSNPTQFLGKPIAERLAALRRDRVGMFA